MSFAQKPIGEAFCNLLAFEKQVSPPHLMISGYQAQEAEIATKYIKMPVIYIYILIYIYNIYILIYIYVCICILPREIGQLSSKDDGHIKRYQGRLGLAAASASGSNPSTCNSTSTTRPSGGWVMVIGLGGVASPIRKLNKCEV